MSATAVGRTGGRGKDELEKRNRKSRMDSDCEEECYKCVCSLQSVLLFFPVKSVSQVEGWVTM